MKKIVIKDEFKSDWISRAAGERLRHMIVEATAHGEPVEIDFTHCVVASTSFFDEGVAKLTELGWTQEKLNTLVRFKNIYKKDRLVLEKMCQNRGMK